MTIDLLERLRDPWHRRRVLHGGAAAMATLAVARPGRLFAADKPTLVNSIRSLTNPYHATWNKGGAAFANSVGSGLRDPGHRGQQREGRLRHQGDAGQDRRQLRASTSIPTTARTRGRSSRPAKAAGAYVVTQWNKPADLHPWDYRPQLRRAHLVQRRALRQGHGRGADQGDGRQGRHRGARRHRIQCPGDRAQEGPRAGAGREFGRQAAGLPGRQLVGDRGAGEDERLADPVRRQDRRHLGGQ